MMTPDKLKDFVNSSGFPLQIGLEHLVKITTSSHGWKVVYKEHSWKNKDTHNDGFIVMGSSLLIALAF